MRINRLFTAVAIVGLVVLTSNVMAAEVTLLQKAAMRIDGPLPKGDHIGAPTSSTACPAADVGMLSDGDTIVGSTVTSTDDFEAGCGSQPGGADEIFAFSVDLPGEWRFDTCTVPACWDTTLEIREDTGSGCPGDFVACDGDGCNVCYWESALQTFLIPAVDYYLIVDAFIGGTYGDFTVTVELAVPGCTEDAGCDDGLFCNGAETCITATGQCIAGDRPCQTFEGYDAPCDEDARDSCPKPDDCFIWIADKIGSGYFFPEANHCPTFASWVFDDVQGSHHTTGVLEFYSTPIIARDFAGTAIGQAFTVNQALFTVDGSCGPVDQIPGSSCIGASVIAPGSTPADPMPCSPGPVQLPNNAGNFAVCEIDFFLAYRTAEDGAGMGIAGATAVLGGVGAADDFGVAVIWLEDCDIPGDYGATWFGPGFQADFVEAEVCATAAGRCCCPPPNVSCSLTTEAACPSECTYGFSGTINLGNDGGCGEDPDGDGAWSICGDNCPNTANPGQEDCDGNNVGDACEVDRSHAEDDDGDGECNGTDNCRFTPNPGQEDRDGDGVGDLCDPCPDANPDDVDNDGVCDDVDICLGFDDNDDADGDGVPGNGGCNPPSNSNGCDCCPDHDDGIAGALGDDDGDGVLNCNDQCNGVDDAVFAPECSGRIPTVSEWGLVVLALLLLVAGKVYFGRRESLA